MSDITWIDEEFKLGVQDIDSQHQEFVELLTKISTADDEALPDLFDALLNKTEKHFSTENHLMLTVNFFATAIHQAEHAHVIKMMRQVSKKIRNGNTELGREYARDYLYDWFNTHVTTMDKALATTLQKNLMS
jgi:hemerythrin-like metal-binding protein